MRKNSTDHLPAFRVRPRFELEVKESPEELLEQLREGLRRNREKVKARIQPGHATVFVPEEEQHFWSPQLTLNIEEIEGGSLLRGMYGPAPSVWTMFVFFYAALGFAIMVIFIIGTSQMMLDKPCAILWTIPFLFGLLLTLYLVSFFGQKMGHHKMVTLHNFIEDTMGVEVGEKFHIL